MQSLRRAPAGRFLLLALALLIPGCGANSSSTAAGTEPQWVGRLDVTNRSSSDMDIYVVRGSDRLRIGLAPNNRTTTFKLSPAQVAGASMLRFVAIPLAGGGETARTEPIHVSPKDVVVLDIPPP